MKRVSMLMDKKTKLLFVLVLLVTAIFSGGVVQADPEPCGYDPAGTPTYGLLGYGCCYCDQFAGEWDCWCAGRVECHTCGAGWCCIDYDN